MPELSRFVDQHHGHVITGNLEIVRNLQLREIMEKGAKYREVPKISMTNLRASLYKDIDRYCEKWSKLETKDEFAESLEDWKLLLKKRIDERLRELVIVHPLKGNAILEKPEVKSELARLHSKFVFTVVDKCSNNFAIQ